MCVNNKNIKNHPFTFDKLFPVIYVSAITMSTSEIRCGHSLIDVLSSFHSSKTQSIYVVCVCMYILYIYANHSVNVLFLLFYIFSQFLLPASRSYFKNHWYWECEIQSAIWMSINQPSVIHTVTTKKESSLPVNTALINLILSKRYC